MTSDPLKNDALNQPSAMNSSSIKNAATHAMLIRLPLTSENPVYWSTETEYGVTSIAELESLTALANTNRCRILVPGEAVGLHAIEHAGKLNHTVQQSLPWRLEDDLAAEVDDTHFALLKHHNGVIHMAAVAKSYMQQWQEWLQEAGINSQQWLPDTLALPFADNECTILQLDEHFLVRTGEWQASVCDSAWLPLYLKNLNSESDDIMIRALSPLPEGSDESTESITVSHDNALQTMLEPVSRSTANLLQGEWQAESTVIRQLKPWRTAAALLLTTCALMLGVNMASTASLESQSDALRTEAYGIYNDLFPGERVIRLEFSLNQKLSGLKQPGDTNDSGLPALLNALAPAFKAEPNLKPVQLDYDHGRQELRMNAESTSFNTFSRFRENAPASVSVTVQTVEQQDDVVTGALVIRSNEQ